MPIFASGTELTCRGAADLAGDTERGPPGGNP